MVDKIESRTVWIVTQWLVQFKFFIPDDSEFNPIYCH
jgi:hypothetical protein